MKKRVSNDIKIEWTILRNKIAEDFSDATNIRLVARIVNSKDIDITEYSEREDNLFRIRIPASILNIGTYTLILTYQKPDVTIVGGFATHGVDIKNAFEVVRNSEQEDDEGKDITSDAHYAVDGATFTPTIIIQGDDIILSWSNNKGLINPADRILNEGVPEAVLAANNAATIANTKAGEANSAAISANNAASLANEVATHPPIITNGTWHFWDTDIDAYVDSGQAATPYENYLQNTTDSPVLTEAEWSVWSKEQGDFAKEQGELAQTAREGIKEDLALKIDKTSIISELGDSEELVMSQKAVTDEITQLAGEVSLLDAVQEAKIKDIESIISTMNPNQSAQLSVSGVSPLSLPKNAANGGMSVKLEGLTADVGGVITNFEPTGRVRSAGKNLFDIRTKILYQGLAWGDNNGAFVAGAFNIYGLIPVEAGKSYYKTNMLSWVMFYDINKVMIPFSGIASNPFTVPFGAYFLSVGIANINTAQLVRTTISTLYEPYRETSLYLPAPELKSNGAVKDEIRKGANGYELVKRVGHINADSLTWEYHSSWSTANYYSVRALTPDFAISSVVINYSLENYGGVYTADSTAQAVYDGLTVRFVGHLYIKVPKTDFAVLPTNLTVKNWLSSRGIKLTANLATPVISPISFGGILNSAENGTVYHEPIIADAGVYDTKMDILLTDYPIATIEEIIKHENGVDTYLNVATAVIAGDGLSFTHPNLTSGDLVLFTYAFDKESTNGNITASFYDSNVVKIDTVTGKAYRINEVVTNGALTRTLTEV